MTDQPDALLPCPDTYPTPEQGWVCFHCGEHFPGTFEGSRRARDHFGWKPSSVASCQIERGDLRRLRAVEHERDRLKEKLDASPAPPTEALVSVVECDLKTREPLRVVIKATTKRNAEAFVGKHVLRCGDRFFKIIPVATDALELARKIESVVKEYGDDYVKGGVSLGAYEACREVQILASRLVNLLARPTAAPEGAPNDSWPKLRRIYSALPKRPRCRDCADENGTCPYSGYPCDPTEEVIARLSRKEPTQRLEGDE